VGHGEDLEDDYMALGWLNPLPPQAGIPGWQRITFMKHFNEDLNDLMEDNLWAYEGVVLPGGRIILGRWWFASEPNVSDAIALSTLNAVLSDFPVQRHPRSYIRLSLRRETPYIKAFRVLTTNSLTTTDPSSCGLSTSLRSWTTARTPSSCFEFTAAR
jgi:hypothetical protein